MSGKIKEFKKKIIIIMAANAKMTSSSHGVLRFKFAKTVFTSLICISDENVPN